MSRLTDSLRTAVEDYRHQRVPLDLLTDAAHRADSALLTAVDRRDRLAAAITELVTEGVVKLPVGKKGWDHTALPALPRWVEKVSPARRRATQPAARAWVPALSFAADRRLMQAERIILERVNDFLRDGGQDAEPVPLRERSYELFRDEKRLDSLPEMTMVVSGDLSLERHLRAFLTPPPLHIFKIGTAPWGLIIENSATLASARAVMSELQRTDPTTVGWLGYGAGKLVVRSILSLVEMAEELGPSLDRLYYFGDLDAEGVRMPQQASERALGAGLPAATPAVELYEALLACPPRAGDQVAPEQAREVALWLPPTLAGQAETLFTTGMWLPQEALSRPTLRTVLTRQVASWKHK